MQAPGALFLNQPFSPDPLRADFMFYVMLGVIGVVGSFLLFFFIVCLCERQRLTGDVEPASEPFPYPPAPYWTATRDDAMKYGLQHAGDFATRKKSSVVKGLLSLFVSRDRQVLAAIVCGSFAAAKTRKTILRSRLATGRILESSDEGGIEDLSGVVERAVLINAGISELMAFHLQRLQTSGSTALAFDAQAPLQEYERIDMERGARWVLLGLARWVGPERAAIRMTPRGAFATMKKLINQTQKMKNQHQRIHIRRAGSRPGD